MNLNAKEFSSRLLFPHHIFLLCLLVFFIRIRSFREQNKAPLFPLSHFNRGAISFIQQDLKSSRSWRYSSIHRCVHLFEDECQVNNRRARCRHRMRKLSFSSSFLTFLSMSTSMFTLISFFIEIIDQWRDERTSSSLSFPSLVALLRSTKVSSASSLISFFRWLLEDD